MAKFVGQRHYIAGFIGVIHENVRVYARQATVAESPAALSWAELRVDPVLVKELANNLASFRAEGGIAFLHDFLGFRPRTGGMFREQRGVAVVIVEQVQLQ